MAPKETQVRPPVGMCPRKGAVRVSELHLDQLRGMRVCSGRERGSRTVTP